MCVCVCVCLQDLILNNLKRFKHIQPKLKNISSENSKILLIQTGIISEIQLTFERSVHFSPHNNDSCLSLRCKISYKSMLVKNIQMNCLMFKHT